MASPFQLKMQSLADAAGQSWRRLPDQGGTLESIATFGRLNMARRQQAVGRFPRYRPELDEYPAVPFYSLDGRAFYYDSSGLALHLDARRVARQPLLPQEPALRFLCRLIDEAFDEFGLYMVHHNRWVTSAATNTMGSMTARELHAVLPPPLRGTVARRLAQRQVRRCPYLFSVAPKGFQCGMTAALTPPSREGFPATHDLLDRAWGAYLDAIEGLLSRQPYLLGQRFTLADAGAYGQLGMNLVDGRAADLLRERAPRTFNWLEMIRDGRHRDSGGELRCDENLRPLLDCISETFVPLMRQNEAAHQRAVAGGQALFNEAAFDRGQALYEGTLMGVPFRSVVKTFQVEVWQTLREQWQALSGAERDESLAACPCLATAFIDPEAT